MRGVFLTSLLSGIALLTHFVSPAAAHPHIFVDAGLHITRDAQGRPVLVDVTWRYDELYSLLLLQDYGLDPDFDVQLTEAEIAETLGFDLNWNGGFEGGLSLMQGETALVIGAPEPLRLTLLPSGQIETTHRRPILQAEAGVPLVAQIYDPEFYIAFEMILDLTIDAGNTGDTGGTGDTGDTGDACESTLIRADLDAAYAGLEAAIEDIGGAVAAEDNFPAVGALFADRAVFSCSD